MSQLKIIFCIAFLAIVLKVAGQVDSSTLKAFTFIQSLKQCTVSEIQEIACDRVWKTKQILNRPNGNMYDYFDLFYMGGTHLDLDYTDTSMDDVKKVIQASNVSAIVYENPIKYHAFRGLKCSSFTTNSVSLPGVELSLVNDSISVLIYGGYRVAVHVIDNTTKELYETFLINQSKDYINVDLRLKYRHGNTYNFELQEKFDLRLLSMSNLLSIAFR